MKSLHNGRRPSPSRTNATRILLALFSNSIFGESPVSLRYTYFSKLKPIRLLILLLVQLLMACGGGGGSSGNELPDERALFQTHNFAIGPGSTCPAGGSLTHTACYDCINADTTNSWGLFRSNDAVISSNCNEKQWSDPQLVATGSNFEIDLSSDSTGHLLLKWRRVIAESDGEIEGEDIARNQIYTVFYDAFSESWSEAALVVESDRIVRADSLITDAWRSRTFWIDTRSDGADSLWLNTTFTVNQWDSYHLSLAHSNVKNYPRRYLPTPNIQVAPLLDTSGSAIAIWATEYCDYCQPDVDYDHYHRETQLYAASFSGSSGYEHSEPLLLASTSRYINSIQIVSEGKGKVFLTWDIQTQGLYGKTFDSTNGWSEDHSPINCGESRYSYDTSSSDSGNFYAAMFCGSEEDASVYRFDPETGWALATTIPFLSEVRIHSQNLSSGWAPYFFAAEEFIFFTYTDKIWSNTLTKAAVINAHRFDPRSGSFQKEEVFSTEDWDDFESLAKITGKLDSDGNLYVALTTAQGLLIGAEKNRGSDRWTAEIIARDVIIHTKPQLEITPDQIIVSYLSQNISDNAGTGISGSFKIIPEAMHRGDVYIATLPRP